MNPENRIRALLNRNKELTEELLDKAAKGLIPELDDKLTVDNFIAFIKDKRKQSKLHFAAASAREPECHLKVSAICHKYSRPVLLIKNGSYEAPNLHALCKQLEPYRNNIEQAIKSVGRVEFPGHIMTVGGTGWLVEKNIVITNRHVAEHVAESNGHGGFRFRISPDGKPFVAKIDFYEESGSFAALEYGLNRVRYIARTDQPDIALLELDVDGRLPDPIAMTDESIVEKQQIGLIGYPLNDGHSDPDDVRRYFGEIFGVKRLAPGEIIQAERGKHFFRHDATTLGGNSGSVVIDLATGRAVGLHYDGSPEGNYAVTTKEIKRALRGLRVTLTVPKKLSSSSKRPDGSHPSTHFRGRKGYDPEFLGRGKMEVSLPGLNDWQTDAAESKSHDGKKAMVLDYMHFSVVFSISLKIPIFSAVNIDGTKNKKIKRRNHQWFKDLRLPAEIQLGKDDFIYPDIYRGQNLRKEYPSWGKADIAIIANEDTFHYTNAVPLCLRMNQAEPQWRGLEDYVLESEKTHKMRICVFTGPVIRESDPQLENGMKVPEEFWKVIVAVDDNTRVLRTTGFVLSQGRLVEDITDSFVYGQYRTYQVPVFTIAEATGLDFGVLVNSDPMFKFPVPEAIGGIPPIIPLDHLEAMVL